MDLQKYQEDIDVGKYWLILKRHWLPAGSVFLAVLLLTGVYMGLRKPVYEAEGKILFRKRDTASALLSEEKEKVGELEALSQQTTPVDTEAEVVRSTPLLQQTIAALKLKDEDGKPLPYRDFQKKLTVKAVTGTDVLAISYQSKDPEEAATVVNKLIEFYLQSNIQVHRTQAAVAREFVSKELPKTEAKLIQAEKNLRDFKEKNGVVALENEAASAVESITLLNNQIATANAELATTNAQLSNLQEKIGLSPEVAASLNALSQSSGVQEALVDLQKVDSELAVQRSRYLDDNPAVVNLKQRQTFLRGVVQERISQVLRNGQAVPGGSLQLGASEQKLIDDYINAGIQRSGLINQINSLVQTQSVYRQRAGVIPRLEQVQSDLERQVETAKANYEILVKRLQEAQIAENQNIGNARVVANATVPDEPIASKNKLILGGGVIVASLLYVLIAFTLDLRDPSLKTIKEIREVLNYPWLGMIPLVKRNKKKQNFAVREAESSSPALPVRETPHSLASEAYRMLQSNLKFLKPDQVLKTIVVTSSVSKEGKSTVSANLALTLSQMGHKVLLVDADLHHPVQHHIWQLTNVAGLSDIIVNQVELKEAIKEVEHNLSVLPAGSIPPNPLALIDSNRMRALVQNLSAKYDFVIFDTPPLILVSDVLTLSKMTSGILLVAHPHKIDGSTAKAARELLAQSEQEVLGLVVNGVVAEYEPDSYPRHVKVYHKDSSPALSRI